MKVVILCGGLGTRLKEETEFKPKPMVEIGGKPILWHIMKIYAHYGFNDFILCLGYKGEKIKEYFSGDYSERNWRVNLVDTGEKAQTGSRIKKVEKYIDTDAFMLTYGDGVTDIDIKKLLEFHKAEKRIGTVSGVHPSSRFGELICDKGKVVEFNEKPQTTSGYINGGFFIFNKDFFNYLDVKDECSLEKEPLEQLTNDGQLSVFTHEGFWQCMDTQRELDILVGLWGDKKAPWKVW
jgi:glucose-1-phosphate cytidylyltransferase